MIEEKFSLTKWRFSFKSMQT